MNEQEMTRLQLAGMMATGLVRRKAADGEFVYGVTVDERFQLREQSGRSVPNGVVAERARLAEDAFQLAEALMARADLAGVLTPRDT